jgi:hypothetical protein
MRLPTLRRYLTSVTRRDAATPFALKRRKYTQAGTARPRPSVPFHVTAYGPAER